MKQLFTTYFLLVSAYCLAQTPIRVQNGQNLQTIIDNAPAGSTILVDAGSYGAVVLNKRITLIGAGGFSANPTTITKISFNLGSDNSSMIGCKIADSPNQEGVFINFNISNILIKNNYILAGISTPKTYCDSNCGPINNLNIIQNIVAGNIDLYDYTKINNFKIKNNVFGSFTSIPHSHENYEPITGEIINNNIMYANQGMNTIDLYAGMITCAVNQGSNVLFKNNIMYFSNYYCFHYTYYFNYNILNREGLNETNTLVEDFGNFFIGVPLIVGAESLPFQLQLAANSPARGAGENGTDCGIFGGSDPFPLSGAIGPQIYDLSAPSSVSSGQTLNVTVKAKVSN